MKKIVNALALCAMIAVASSCGKSRAEQMKMAENVNVDCTPEVLVLVGDKIDASITVTYPAKYFHPKATLEVTPVLVYEGGEQEGPTFTYQGEKVQANNKVVSYDGGSVTEKVSFTYAPGVEKSYLELRSTAYYKDDAIEIPAIKVADGTNVTQLLASSNGEYSYKQDNYQEVIRSSAEAQILYDINSSTVKNSQLRSDSVKALQAALEEIETEPRYSIAGTRIVSYASPDGGQDLNAKLSDKRAGSAEKVWTKVTGLEKEGVEVQSVGQDWEGFQEAVNASDIQDKELILRVLSMYSDPAVREREIRNMSQVYKEISDEVFPELRRARFIADLDYKNFSDEELVELSNKAIDVLDEESLLRVASVVDDPARKAEIYKKAVDKYGSDRANFNLAVLALNAGKPDEAADYLAAVKESDADVVNAKGVVELQKGNLDAAAKYFKEAGSDAAKANLGTVQILQGNWNAAAATLSGTDSHNKAVAYILTGELDKAEKAITCDCARSNYLRAVVAARKGNSSDVTKYLNKVAEKSPAMMTRAEKDVEFAEYR